MGKECGFPTCGPVAADAVGRGRQVVRWLKGGRDSTTGCMALHTLSRRSSKNALQMAPLAHNLRVTAAEREAGAAVIDFNVGTTGTILSLCLALQHEAKAQGQRD